MRCSLSSQAVQDWSGDVLVVGLLQDQPATELEARFPGLGAALEQQQFKGKPAEQLLINRLGDDSPQRLVVLGLGPANGFNLDGVRSAAARAAKAASGHTGNLGLQLSWDGLEPAAAAAAAARVGAGLSVARAVGRLRALVPPPPSRRSHGAGRAPPRGSRTSVESNSTVELPLGKLYGDRSRWWWWSDRINFKNLKISEILPET